jgi:hypothetical protein
VCTVLVQCPGAVPILPIHSPHLHSARPPLPPFLFFLLHTHSPLLSFPCVSFSFAPLRSTHCAFALNFFCITHAPYQPAVLLHGSRQCSANGVRQHTASMQHLPQEAKV